MPSSRSFFSWLQADLSIDDRVTSALEGTPAEQAERLTLCWMMGWRDAVQRLQAKGVVPSPLRPGLCRASLQRFTHSLSNAEPWNLWQLWSVLTPRMRPAGLSPGDSRLACVEAWLTMPEAWQHAHAMGQGKEDPLFLSLRSAAVQISENLARRQERWAYEDIVHAHHPERRTPPACWLQGAIPGPENYVRNPEAWHDWERVRAWGSPASAAVWTQAQRADHKTVVSALSPRQGWGPRIERLFAEESVCPLDARVTMLVRAVAHHALEELQAWDGTAMLPAHPVDWLHQVIEKDDTQRAWPILAPWPSMPPHANQHDQHGLPAIHQAFQQDHAPALRSLLGWGADAYAMDAQGRYAWECRSCAQGESHAVLMNIFQDHLGLPFQEWPCHQQPLVLTAVAARDKVTLQALMDAGAEVTQVRADGQNALDLLLRQHNPHGQGPQVAQDQEETEAVACWLIHQGCQVKPPHLQEALRRLWPRFLALVLPQVPRPASLSRLSPRHWSTLPTAAPPGGPDHGVMQRLVQCVRLWEQHYPTPRADQAWWAAWRAWPVLEAFHALNQVVPAGSGSKVARQRL